MAPKAQQPLKQRIDRLFSTYGESLGQLSGEELRAVARRFSGEGGGFSVKQLCTWSGRLVLCLLAVGLALVTISNELVYSGYATQSTEWLAASDLAVQKFIRRVSHTLRLYDTELVRGIGDCLLPNPFGKEAPFCCGCGKLRIAKVRVAHDNLTVAVNLIDSLYSRAVNPFLLAGPPAEIRVDFARLSNFVAEHRPEFERGANAFRTVASMADAPTVRRFADLFPADAGARTEPPPGQLLIWSFSHLSAVRALRRLVTRPAYFGQRTERLQSISLLMAGRRTPDRFHSVGDFSGLNALAFAVPLNGRLRARLAPKPICCGVESVEPSAPVALEPGRVLFFPTDCDNLQVSAEDDGSPAMLLFGFLYNGAHQARRKEVT